ncbi:glycosyltransferase family protein [Streptoalloteichus hindustanus]|uniref:Membrane protein YfhO n=1 Tax=Streptoalloteichus hindustanus TaxID=2017 RepID=A0A1M4VIW5_STRHI|nr:hypothetical protein [Streptoalloteichus hindustanus]SHE69006.1 hypothetical protein SAMN05444320_101788 [Streptoalloteichus hindustanus]
MGDNVLLPPADRDRVRAERETEPAAEAAEPEPGTAVSRTRVAGRLFAPLAMLVLVAVGAAFPLIRYRIFYAIDDTAAVGIPVWRRMGQALTEGRVPFLELDMWRGGNLAAEAATGLWNPLADVLAVTTYQIDNMALAMTVVKVTFFLVLAGGVYLLSRSYGANPWLAAAVGAAMPFSGYNLFMDAEAWVNAVMVTAFLPWVLWSARRALAGGGSLLPVVVCGFLCAGTGNPYGLLGTAVAIFAALVEAWVSHRRNRIGGVVVAGGTIVLLSFVVYLPFLLTSKVGFRAEHGTHNNEFLSPTLSDLLGISTPSFEPYVNIWGTGYMTFPGVYLAWFVLPLVPWLRWRTLLERWRDLGGLLTFGAVFLLMVLGPEQLWMFRWPARLLPYLLIAVAALFAVLASRGLERTHVARRTGASVAIILLGAYLAWSDTPQFWGRHAVSAVVVVALVLLLVRLADNHRAGFAVMMVGTLAVLNLQLFWTPTNRNVDAYQFPTSQQLVRDRFDQRYPGVTVQIADFGHVPLEDRHPGGAYRDMLFGSNYSAASVEALNAYSGVGFNAMDNTLCMIFQGSTCPEAWDALWKKPEGADRPLADLLRAQTVVVQNLLNDTRNAPAPQGWRRAEVTDRVTVWRRVAPLPWPDARLSAATGVEVTADRMTDHVGEKVSFRRAGQGRASLTFARLAWPGYEVKVNGTPVEWRTGPAGLLTVDLPDNAKQGDVEISWSPPGFAAGLGVFGVGVLSALLLHFVPVLRRRRAAARS